MEKSTQAPCCRLKIEVYARHVNSLLEAREMLIPSSRVAPRPGVKWASLQNAESLYCGVRVDHESGIESITMSMATSVGIPSWRSLPKYKNKAGAASSEAVSLRTPLSGIIVGALSLKSFPENSIFSGRSFNNKALGFYLSRDDQGFCVC